MWFSSFPSERGRPPQRTEWIQAEVERYSDELHDSDHIPQNVGQAARLWKASGLTKAAFCQLMEEARSIAKGDKSKSGLLAKRGTWAKKQDASLLQGVA
jgi:hypothetical protein